MGVSYKGHKIISQKLSYMTRRDESNLVLASVSRPRRSKNSTPKSRHWILKTNMKSRKLGMSEGHGTDSQRSKIGFDHFRVDIWRSRKPISTSKVVEIFVKVLKILQILSYMLLYLVRSFYVFLLYRAL